VSSNRIPKKGLKISTKKKKKGFGKTPEMMEDSVL
jgi:hypothetical protein